MAWRSFLSLVPLWLSPNAITVIGTLLVLPLAHQLAERRYAIFLVLGATIGFSDILDGALARFRGQTSTLGKLIDPVRDKLAVCSTLWILGDSEFSEFSVPAWLVAIPRWSLLSMECILVAIRAPDAYHAFVQWLAGTPDPSKGEVMAANDFGKKKTIVEFVSLAIVVAGLALVAAKAVGAGKLVFIVGWIGLWIAMGYAALSIVGHLGRKKS